MLRSSRHLDWTPAAASVRSLLGGRGASGVLREQEHAAHSSPGGKRHFFWNRGPTGELMGISGLEGPKDFPRLAREAVAEAKRELGSAHQKSAEELVASLDNASNVLCGIADAAELVRNVHPNQEYVARASDAVQEVAMYMGDVNLDTGMYDALKRGESSEDFQGMTFEAKSVLKHMRVSMEHEGVHLPDAEKRDCLQMLEHEQQLSFEIVQRQEQLRRSFDQDSGAWIPKSSLEGALGGAVMQLNKRVGSGEDEFFVPADSIFADQVIKVADCENARRLLHESQQTSDQQGAADMASLLAVRQKLAQMRGYGTWNEYAQREALLGSPDRVDSFLTSAWDRLKPGLEADLRNLAEAKERMGLGSGTLHAWDVPLMLHKCKSENVKDEGRISEYLSYGSMMKGVELICSKLLGVGFHAEEPAKGEVWHSSVQKYTLRDGEKVLGILYLDPFMRPGKVVQSAQFTLQGSKVLPGGDLQVPVTSLVFSLPVGTMGLPLSYAVTFMHEIGHAVHSLLSETTYQHLSGTRGTVDFVEFPSHLFEHFVLDPSCLATFATHGKTGEAMPIEVQRACRTNRLRFAHLEAAQQLMYAVVDQAFYSYCPPPGAEDAAAAEGVRQHLAAAMARFDNDIAGGPFEGSLTHLLGISRPSKFDHLVHYGGSYYCYLFNRALSAHIWEESFRGDPFAADPGERLRGLLKGGSVVQELGAIEALLPPGSGSFRAEDVPLDAFVTRLRAE